MTQRWTWIQTQMSKSSQKSKKIHDLWYQVSIQTRFCLESLQVRTIDCTAAPNLTWCSSSIFFFLKQLSKAVAFPFWKKCLFCFMTSSVMVLPKQPASLRYNVLNEELPACRSDPAQSCRMAPQLSHRKGWGGEGKRGFFVLFLLLFGDPMLGLHGDSESQPQGSRLWALAVYRPSSCSHCRSPSLATPAQTHSSYISDFRAPLDNIIPTFLTHTLRQNKRDTHHGSSTHTEQTMG